MSGYIHVGNLIAELLEAQHRTKKDLALDIGMSQSNVVYLTTRESVDVQTLHKVGNNLRYNFWKHYPIDDGTKDEPTEARLKQVRDEKDKEIAALNEKIAELKQELVKQENAFLKEINGLLKRK